MMQLLGFHMEKSKKYKLKEDFTVENMEKFAESVFDGTAEAEYKSQPIPSDPYDDGVHVVVGKSVDSVVLDPTKDVLLEASIQGHASSATSAYA